MQELGFVDLENDNSKIFAFGNRVKAVRKQKQITQEELAFRAGITTSQVGRIERGKINTGIQTVFVLAMALEVDPGELFTNDYC